MGRKYAYVDEFGAFGFQFDNPTVSSHFIISAIIVDEDKINFIEAEAEKIRAKYFQTGEMKSKGISSDHVRRKRILGELMTLPFNIFVFVADKQKIGVNSGLRYKEPFYKFLNNFVHEELRVSFNELTVIADEIGSNEYMESFSKYFEAKKEPSNLFEECKLDFKNSKNNILIQIADIISGSLAFNFDHHKQKDAQGNDYQRMLSSKILRLKCFPETFESFVVGQNATSQQYNHQIAEIGYRRAKAFIGANRNNVNEDVRQQIITLEYLLFRFMNNNKRQYISTKELINQLIFAGFTEITTQTFRTKVIAKLRDNNVIISSSPKGYKIPTTENELYDFINHGTLIVMPMLSRLKKFIDTIHLGTNGQIDLYQREEYQSLKKLLEN